MPLPGGISNINFVVTDADRRYVVRIAGDVPEHGVLRANEVSVSRAAHGAGLSPAVRHYEAGALVLDFIGNGRPLTADDIGNEDYLPRVVDLIRRCHDGLPARLEVPGQRFWVFQVNRRYARLLHERGSPPATPLVDLMVLNDEFEQAAGPFQPVFAHNDLLAANIIDDGVRLWLVDWEYGGWNAALFDLANLASNNGFTPELEARLLRLYFGAPADAARQQGYLAMKAASLLREALWSLVSALFSPVDFDYQAYADKNLARFAEAVDQFRNGMGNS